MMTIMTTIYDDNSAMRREDDDDDDDGNDDNDDRGGNRGRTPLWWVLHYSSYSSDNYSRPEVGLGCK